MRKFLLSLLIGDRLEFARWAIHSGHCSQSVSLKDYIKFLEQKQKNNADTL